ncbi:unnamed protein product [Porites evermanni]|uniref:Uncharacterized protein n=1 Tax=Porites evermanni TaxID=104178 RepID=A0ABN8LGW6_9CNID|nr:unnamed protein product [Porites evermanni]
MDVRILVQVENRRKIVRVPTGDLQDLRERVFTEFDGILLPQSKVIFQKWDDEFSDYVDLEEGSYLNDKDKVQVLQEFSLSGPPSTPVSEVIGLSVLCFPQQHFRTLTSPGTSSISSAESSKSTISVDTDMSELSDDEAVPQVSQQLKPPQSKLDQGIPIPDGFPSSFKMPQHFGRKVDRALASGEVDNKVRNSVVRTVATCVRAVVNKPTPLMCEYLARKLIQTYPCLRERDPREFLKQAGVKVDNKGKPFKNWAMLKRQFQRKFENMQSGQSDKAEEHPDCNMSGEGSQGSGPTIEVDDTISTERNIKKLKSELTKSKWSTKTVQELLRATFTARRKAMLKVDARNRITKSLQEYRCLSHEVEFEAELLNCLQQTCGISMSMEEMMSSWEKLVDPLINMAQKRKILTSVDEDPDTKQIMALRSLPTIFKLINGATVHDAENHFIFVAKDDASFEAARAKAPSSSPFLMVNPGKQVLLMQSNKESFMELSADSFAKAVVFLVGIYYIFHLEYPGPAKGAFMFLQEHILHDFLSKRPLRYATRLAEMKL